MLAMANLSFYFKIYAILNVVAASNRDYPMIAGSATARLSSPKSAPTKSWRVRHAAQVPALRVTRPTVDIGLWVSGIGYSSNKTLLLFRRVDHRIDQNADHRNGYNRIDHIQPSPITEKALILYPF
jgi:hypothetical protein